jgi:hypothetical protein
MEAYDIQPQETTMNLKLRTLILAALVGDIAWTTGLLGGTAGLLLAATSCVIAGLTLTLIVPKLEI